MTSHRRDVRPRYSRIAVLAAAVTVCVVAALGAFGVLAESSAQAGHGTASDGTTSDSSTASGTTGSGGGGTGSASAQNASDPSAGDPSPTASPGVPSGGVSASPGSTPPDASQGDGTSRTQLPADSGTGRRVVFSQSLQRVWLVGQPDHVQKTYPVSGSVYHNLHPGTYSVYSKSRWAVGVDDTGVMQYFVRFTQGPTGAAIGFHSIPTKDGAPLQTRAQLGTPQSHGCIRQYLPNAQALWNFAPIGTKVVVVA